MRAFASKHAYLLFAPALALLLFLGLQHIAFFQIIDDKTVDLRFQLRQSHDPKADPALLFVPIDEPSLAYLGVWPWPRSVHSDFLQYLAHADATNPGQPAVVGFDVLFTENGNPKDDKAMAESAALLPVVTGALLAKDLQPNALPAIDADAPTRTFPKVKGDISRIPAAYSAPTALFPYPALRRASFCGFVDSHAGSDGMRRKLPLVVRVGDAVYPSLVTQILMRYWHLQPKNVWITLGKSVDFHTVTPDGDLKIIHVPIDRGGEVWINYRSLQHAFSFNRLGYSAVCTALVDTYRNHRPWPANYPTLSGKILLVGENATSLSDMGDYGPTPLEANAPLAQTHLCLLNNILQQDFLAEIPWSWVILGWLAVAYASLWFATRQTSIHSALLILFGAITLYLGAAFALFAWKSLLLPVFWPVGAFAALHFGSIILRWLAEQKSKREIKSIFGSYISPGVMDQLLKHPENVKLGGVDKSVTIFFSDIRSFSTFSENMQEQELVRQLNEYFERMVGCVTRRDGTLHKYIGDAIMAVWGDVIDRDPALDAQNAVRAALEMRRELAELNALRQKEGLFPFHIGMGLNHGRVVVGNIGATQRREFTVIGDAVNLASRLEGVTKQFHTDFVIGESVRAFLGDAFLLRTIGFLVVKGKTKPIRAYEVFGENGDPACLRKPAWAHTYEKGFDLYIERRFAEAIPCFETCLETVPDDFCANEYLRESQALLKTPPPEGWTGVLKLESK